MKKSYKKRSRKRSTKKRARRARRRTKKAGDYSKLAKKIMHTNLLKTTENFNKDRNTYRQLGLTDSQKKQLDKMAIEKKIAKAQKELTPLPIDSAYADQWEKYMQHKRGITKQKFPNQQHGMKYARLHNPATRAKRLRSVINKKKELENKAAQIKKPNDLLKQLEEIDEKSKNSGKGTKRKRKGGKRKRKTRRRRRRR